MTDHPPGPRVTVVVPVKDRRERMQRCLDAILAQDYGNYDVLVMDNRSTDRTADTVRALAHTASVPVRVVVDGGSVGRLRNLAAELTDAEVLAYTDSDCMPSPRWLRGGVAALCSDPGVGIVQGRTLPEPGRELRAWAATICVTEPTGRFESCNLLIRRDALRQSDGFDESIGHFWEDTAAGWSILRAGWRAAFAAEAVVHHDVTHPGLLWWLRRAQRYGNAAAVVRRYPELRRRHLWGRYFLRPRSAAFAAAVAGIVLARIHRGALCLCLPYARIRRPRRLTVGDVSASAQIALFDAAIFVGMLRGSVRHRTLVL